MASIISYLKRIKANKNNANSPIRNIDKYLSGKTFNFNTCVMANKDIINTIRLNIFLINFLLIRWAIFKPPILNNYNMINQYNQTYYCLKKYIWYVIIFIRVVILKKRWKNAKI